MVEDGENGYLVDAQDVDMFAKYICRILKGDDKTYIQKALENVKPFMDVYVREELKQLYGLYEGRQLCNQ